jgi:hypothetical protein
MIVKVKGLCKYNGHSIKNNRAVDLSLVFAYDELPNYIKLVQLLNEHIDVSVKIGDQEVEKIGNFMIRAINIDHDGQGVIKLNSQMDHVEADLINNLVSETFKILFVADVEDIEDDEEED